MSAESRTIDAAQAQGDSTEVNPAAELAIRKMAARRGISPDALLASALAEYLTKQKRGVDPASKRQIRNLQAKIRALENKLRALDEAVAAVGGMLKAFSAPIEKTKRRIGF